MRWNEGTIRRFAIGFRALKSPANKCHRYVRIRSRSRPCDRRFSADGELL